MQRFIQYNIKKNTTSVEHSADFIELEEIR